MKTFTFDEFKGYEFNCEVGQAPVGFKHTCVVTKDGETVAQTAIQYLNRTWEAFQFASVLEQAKEELSKTLSPEIKPEINTDFLYTLVMNEYIADFGTLHGSDEVVMLMDSWEQVEGTTREWSDTEKRYVKCEVKPSVYAKLRKLAEENRLKPSINYTMLNVEYVFSDEYKRCDECGDICNMFYGEISWVEEADQYLCCDCATADDYVLEAKIESAKEDFSKAVPVEYSDEKIEALGYTKLNNDSFTTYKERLSQEYIDIDFAKELCETFGGFVKLDWIEPFDTLYSIYIPSTMIEVACKSVSENRIVA